ncbi:hexokinase family protein [Aspergillus steynii IBT 23096]|uniref:Phosphotransferase n=1 Tax=Aspergillus steynii IBT 23096 TaxID=1392250 RepID=A0A2I2FYW1_9EURO|nr:hexokinase family protein [Aspergillus steynii IBT 23096]PLB45817.1 hexokinase family protein [Aspergillus steynii IBT 23096]
MSRPTSAGQESPTAIPDRSEFLAKLLLDVDTLYRLSSRLSSLYRKIASTPSKQFFPTAITRLPTGHETGRYLAVYVGLSYLRVAFIDLLKDQPIQGQSRVRRTLEKAWPIEEHLRRDDAFNLFTWIGDCIAEVVADSLDNPRERMPSELTTGISFCLPLEQKSLDEAILMPTGKGFVLSSDLNLRQALLRGYERHTRSFDEDRDRPGPAKKRKLYSLPTLKIAVMTNDTGATLASLAYSIPSLPNTRVVMGLIVGAGCNATVPFPIADLHESKTRDLRLQEPDAVETLVSTEWTLSSAAAPLNELGIITAWDEELDKRSKRPGFQPFEYMVGGAHVGELVRIITFDWFHRVCGVAASDLPPKLVQERSLQTDFLSLEVASAHSKRRLAVTLSKHLPPPEKSSWTWTPESASDLRAISAAIQDRAASLVASAVVGLLVCTREIRLQNPESSSSPNDNQEPISNEHPLGSGWKNGPEELAVAVSGGVIQHYPNYKATVQRYIDRLILRAGPQDGGKSVFLREVSDGGIIGVGVLAGMASGEIGEIILGSLDRDNHLDDDN